MSLNLIETGTNTLVKAVGLKDGSLIAVDWLTAQGIKGNVFHAYLGSASTEITLDAGYANTDPDISLDVPQGRIVIPICIRAIVQEYGSTGLFEVFSLCSRTLAASSAGTAFAPINMRQSGGGSACSVYTGPTVTNGNTTGAFELGRATVAKAATIGTGDDDSSMEPGVYEWNIKQNAVPVILEGPASIATWVIGQASKGYIQYWWVELNEGDI